MGDETIMLLSNDDRCYYVNRDVASVSQVITARLESDFKEGQSKEIHLEEIDGDTLEKCIEYMHYKFINTQRKQYETEENPVDEQFDIEPEEALSLLKAGIYLEC
ncbi:unnamed protein product [Moneuplotes crassus]|uniref:Elongin-C n=1 Tax=Euplotes crassus TaxID=5936 RepID=A0AAD2D7I0_EUPCR|nr:unnamed protein product [Moneuplotes crassus]